MFPAVSSHRLGFAVKVLGEGGLASHDTRRWQSEPHLRVSLEKLREILSYLDRNDLRMYRMATALAPYASHPGLPRFHRQVEECAAELAAIGDLARELDIRLSSHPGQYTVLNSERPEVRDSAVAELEVQGALFEGMGLGTDAVVVVHVGGKAGGGAAAMDRFLGGYELLSERARRYVVIENDDRSFCVADAVALSGRCGVRVVWDILHHHCHNPSGLGDRQALELALGTWSEGEPPKIHLSSPRLDLEERKRKVGRRIERRLVLPQLRAHADLVDPIGFESFLREVEGVGDFDVMVEAKGKDLAVLRLRGQLRERGFGWERGRLVSWAPRAPRPPAPCRRAAP